MVSLRLLAAAVPATALVKTVGKGGTESPTIHRGLDLQLKRMNSNRWSRLA
jgi:hypothetical protein